MASLLNDAFDFISKNENVKKEFYDAKWDVRRYSIGFGTISYAGERISYEEAKARSMEFIEREIKEMERLYPKWNYLNHNQKIAVLDFGYQYGVGGFLNNSFRRNIDNNTNLDYAWADSTPYKSRNRKRIDKFNEKPINTAGAIFFLIVFGLAILYKRKKYGIERS
jgi:GH24 family phage-related lysozyme (muramidase)